MIKRSDNPVSGYYGPGHNLGYRNMTTEEERELFERYRKEGDLSARDEVIENQLLYAAGIAIRAAPNWMPIDEVVSAGNAGLIKAAEKFDYTNGARFASYLRKFVRGEVYRACREKVSPVHVPNGQMVPEGTHWGETELLPEDAILDEPQDGPDEEAENVDRVEYIKKCVTLALNDKGLEVIERHVIVQHFFKGKTFKQIADRMPKRIGRPGLARQRIGQIKNRACEKLRSILARHGIREMI